MANATLLDAFRDNHFLRFFDGSDVSESNGTDCRIGIEHAFSFDCDCDNMLRVYVRRRSEGTVEIECSHVQNGQRYVGVFDGASKNVGKMLSETSAIVGNLSRE